jgi:hypothetical protein
MSIDATHSIDAIDGYMTNGTMVKTVPEVFGWAAAGRS